MLSFIHGNLFDARTQTIVNPVNTVGIAGRGLALEFAKRYPTNDEHYRAMCAEKKMCIGTLLVTIDEETGKRILNFPTKTDWRQPSHPAFIHCGLRYFVARYQEMGITSIAFPKLGCGLGGLNFQTQVKPLMEQHLSDLPIEVVVYA